MRLGLRLTLGIEAGADGIVIETMSDPAEASLAAAAAHATGLPVVACMTFDSGAKKDRTMMGATPEQAAEQLSAVLKIPEKDLAKPLIDLRARRLIGQTPDGVIRITADGQALRERMITARSARIEELLARWEPEKHPEVKAQFQRLAENLSRELPVQ